MHSLPVFLQLGGAEESDPVERLRFFCSIAMSNDDWLDVEPFFNDIIKILLTLKVKKGIIVS